MKRFLLLICIAFTVVPAEAQRVFSLDDCIQTGLERNYSIRIIRNEQQISDNNATPGNAGYLPTVDLSSGFSGTLNNNNNKLSDGTTEKTNGIHNETADIGLNVNWTVFDGLGIQATYEKLKELQNLGELNTRMTIEDFVADLSSEYYNLIRQKIRLRNLRSTLELSRERLRIVEERYYIGSMSRLDLQQAQVDFNADSSNVLNQLEQVHTSRIRLNRLMALEDVEEQVLIKDSLITPNPFLDEVELWKSTLTSNSSLLIAKKNQVISELDYKKIKSRNYPYVKLNAGYGYTANWYEVGTTWNDRPPAPPRPQLWGDGRHQRIRRFQPETRTTECPDTDSEPRIAHTRTRTGIAGRYEQLLDGLSQQPGLVEPGKRELGRGTGKLPDCDRPL